MENISPNNDKFKEKNREIVPFSEKNPSLMADDMSKEPIPFPVFYQPFPGAYERIFEIMSKSV